MPNFLIATGLSITLLMSGDIQAKESTQNQVATNAPTEVIASNNISESVTVNNAANGVIAGEGDEKTEHQTTANHHETSDQVNAASEVSDSPKVGKHVNKEIDLLSMIVSLSIVVSVILVTAFLLKRVQGGKSTQDGLKLISSLHIGTKEKIVVVQAGKQQWVLGVTPHQINLLSELEESLPVKPELTPTIPKALAAFLGKSPLVKTPPNKAS